MEDNHVAFESKNNMLLEPKLRPPFDLTIPDQQQYAQLNSAILCGVLCKPHFAKTHKSISIKEFYLILF